MIVAPEILSVAGGWGREHLGPVQEEKRIGIKDYPRSTSVSPYLSLTRR